MADRRCTLRGCACGDALRECERVYALDDLILEALPLISSHDEPQVSPQEYECGCVTVTRITDRDYRHGESPFEMRLAIPCGTSTCEVNASHGGK